MLRVTGYGNRAKNTSVLPAVLRSRDIQGIFFSVAQSKNEDRDVEELQQ